MKKERGSTEMPKNMMQSALGLLTALGELVYPSDIYCICCGRTIAPGMPYSLCGSCVRMLHWVGTETCTKCGKPLKAGSEKQVCLDCIQTEHPFERGYSCAWYGRMERELIHRMKYKKQPYYAEKLAELMYERIELERLDREEFSPEIIVPVPMYKRKQKERGYNQAALLACTLAHRMELPFRADLLLRTKDTRPMNALSAEERRENIKGVFTVSEKKVKLIEHRNILLVDDVYTTGSTADACSEVLNAAGAAKVYVLSFASGMDR